MERRGRIGRDDQPAMGSYFHPRAYEACEPEEGADLSPLEPPPSLIQDSSSSSERYEEEDDDDEAITPPDPKLPASLIIPHALRSGTATFKSTGALIEGDSPVRFAPSEPKLRPSAPRIRTGNGGFIMLRGTLSPVDGEGCLGGF